MEFVQDLANDGTLEVKHCVAYRALAHQALDDRCVETRVKVAPKHRS